MCNLLHDDAKHIKKAGFGWKIFTLRSGELHGPYRSRHYTKSRHGWISWIPAIAKLDYTITNMEEDSIAGFGFFLEEGPARKLLDLIKSVDPRTNYVLLKIQYKEGLGSNTNTFESTFEATIALCRKFKILEEEPANV